MNSKSVVFNDGIGFYEDGNELPKSAPKKDGFKLQDSTKKQREKVG
jgi:hypothetical protein